MADTSLRVAPGTVLAEKYRVEEVLGEGGMGVVVRATHLLLDEPVALKFLLPELANDPQACARFLREAKAAMRIRGEHVAQVLDVGELSGGEPYIVMEYLQGRDLEEELDARGPLSVAEAVSAVLQACRALHDAHAAGVVHRDIKPANLFQATAADGRRVIKVLDFGISKLSGEQVDNLTRTDTVMGSALYMSPEQLLSSRDVDARTDIYALGVTLFQLLTCGFPFVGETMPQLVANVLTGKPRSLRALQPDLPEGLELVLVRATARDPALRYPTVAALAEALAPFANADHRVRMASFAPVTSALTVAAAHAETMSARPETASAYAANPAAPWAGTHAATSRTLAHMRPRRARWPWLVGGGATLVAVAVAIALMVGGGGAATAPDVAAEPVNAAADPPRADREQVATAQAPAPAAAPSTDAVSSAEVAASAEVATSVSATPSSSTPAPVRPWSKHAPRPHPSGNIFDSFE